MRNHKSQLLVCMSVFFLAAPIFAQKVKVGYDKGVDFSKYKTYTWAPAGMPPVYPVLYQTVVSTVDSELQNKGLKRADNDGDLTLVGAGGLDFGRTMSAGTPVGDTSTGPGSWTSGMWTGTGGGQLLAVVPDGTLQLQFVDRGNKQVVWSGTVSEKLDIEQKEKSLQLVNKAVVKLLKEFPPKGSAKGSGR